MGGGQVDGGEGLRHTCPASQVVAETRVRKGMYDEQTLHSTTGRTHCRKTRVWRHERVPTEQRKTDGDEGGDAAVEASRRGVGERRYAAKISHRSLLNELLSDSLRCGTWATSAGRIAASHRCTVLWTNMV